MFWQCDLQIESIKKRKWKFRENVPSLIKDFGRENTTLTKYQLLPKKARISVQVAIKSSLHPQSHLKAYSAKTLYYSVS